MAELSWASKSDLGFAFAGAVTGFTGAPSVKSFLCDGGETLGIVLSSFSNFPVPINSMTALPKECDSEVGGVLTRLLDPAVVEANADEIEEEDEDVDGELITRGGTAVIPFAASILAVLFGKGSFLGAEADNPLGTLGALELKLATVPLE